MKLEMLENPKENEGRIFWDASKQMWYISPTGLVWEVADLADIRRLDDGSYLVRSRT